MSRLVKDPTTMLYPVPAVLVSCGSGEQANIITLAWVGTLCSEPPMVGIGVRPSRHSHKLIADGGEFVVNLPSTDQVEAVDHCGTVSGRDEDKWETCGFTPVPASKVQVPLVGECPVNLECIVRQTVTLGSHDLFVGEVVAVQVDEAVLNERGQVDIGKAKPFAYARGEYWGMGEQLAIFGFSK